MVMMTEEEEFRVPVHLRDLELSGQWVSRRAEPPVNKEEALDTIDLALREQSIVDAVTASFETWYLLVRDAESMNEAISTRVAWSLCEALLDASRSEAVRLGGDPDGATARSERNAFFMTAYLCQAAILAAERHIEQKKMSIRATRRTKSNRESSDDDKEEEDDSESSDEDDSDLTTRRRASNLFRTMNTKVPKRWVDARTRIIKNFGAVLLAIDLNRLWQLGVCGDEFLALWTKLGLALFQPGSLLGTDLVLSAIKLAPEAEQFCVTTAAVLVEDMIMKSGQTSAHAASICLALNNKMNDNYSRLCSALFAEMSRAVTEEDIVGFVPQFFQALKPSFLVSRGAELRALLNSARAHAVRSSIVTAICSVLAEDAAARRRKNGRSLFNQDSQRDAALELVASRARDMNYFSRATTLRELAHLAQAKAVPCAEFPALFLRAAIDRLNDRAALVRKAALELCTSLLEHNPYHGDLSPSNTTLFPKELPHCQSEAYDTPRSTAMTQYRRNANEFIQELQVAAPRVEKLLASPTMGDALGATKFFAAALRFRLPLAEDGMHSALRLVWSPDHAVRVAVAPLLAEALAAVQPVRICELTGKWTQRHTELAQFEDLVGILMNSSSSQDKKSTISSPLLRQQLIDALWTLAETQPAAVRILAVFAKCGVKLSVDDHLERLIHIQSSPEMLAAVATLVRDAPGTTPHFLQTLREALAQPSEDDGAPYWYVATDAVVAATFAVDPAPEAALAAWLHSLRTQAGSTVGLARLLHLAGHGALQIAAAAEDLGSKLAASRRAKHQSEKDTEAKGDQQAMDDDDLEAEARRATEADDETRLAELIDQGLVAGDDNALAALIPVAENLVDASLTTGDKPPPLLTRAAALCLVKMACVARPCCERQLPRLVTLLAEPRADTAARVSVAVGLGDLATRQPNAVEPWTDAIFAVLGDEHCVALRANLLAVVGRLVINDILKLKGNGLAEVATRLVDPDAAVAASAKALFASLNAKAHRQASPIYNLLPDVLSRLAPKHPDLFKPVVTYLLKFVDQPKHIVAIADKILRRLAAIKNQDNALVTLRNLSFALSKLPVSDKFLSKLLDLLPIYKDILATEDQVIKAAFRDILNKAKRLNNSTQQSSELASLVTTFAEKLKVSNGQPNSDDDEFDDDVSIATVPVTITKTPRVQRTPRPTLTTIRAPRTKGQTTTKKSSDSTKLFTSPFYNRTNDSEDAHAVAAAADYDD